MSIFDLSIERSGDVKKHHNPLNTNKSRFRHSSSHLLQVASMLTSHGWIWYHTTDRQEEIFKEGNIF